MMSSYVYPLYENLFLSFLASIYSYYYTGSFQADSVVKNLPPNAGTARDTGSNPGLGRSSGMGNGNQLQYYCLGNFMQKEALQATVRGVSKS